MSSTEKSMIADKVPLLSVIVASYNRGPLLQTLLKQFSSQNFPPEHFELLVVDDGSKEPVQNFIAAESYPFRLTIIRQANGGAAAARHRGITDARAAIVLIIDDDMEIGTDFLQAHWDAHQAGADVVLGRISLPTTTRMPLFERFHAAQIDRLAAGFVRGNRVRGVNLWTGNVSFRRNLYLDVGGFDASLRQSEDREIGIRYDKAGATFAFADQARSIHHSDHSKLKNWLGRATGYGLWDARIGEKHPDHELANPWRFLYRVSPLSRPLLFFVVLLPSAATPLMYGIMATAKLVDHLGLEKLALFGTTLAYGVAYFRGVRQHAGSTKQALQQLRAYRTMKKQMTSSEKKSWYTVAKEFKAAVRADYESVRRYRAKYHEESIPVSRMGRHYVEKIGFQIATGIRVMQALHAARIPLMPQIASRMMRHLYGTEIHWLANIAPGISIVHGNGLVISRGATINQGCILFHNVTLGEGIDPETREVGAPILEEDVHVGPGATLLGPITVGAGSKIMAGAVLIQSVPKNSRVRPAAAEIVDGSEVTTDKTNTAKRKRSV